MSIVKIEEKEYRSIKKNSSSSLKDFADDRRKYYRKHVLGETIKEKPNKAANMGRIVETLLMEPERFDEMFFMSSLPKVPGGMLGDFIYYLAELVGEKDVDTDILTDTGFNECALKAYKKAGFKIKFDTVLKKLEDPENELYYSECLKVEHLGMTMVTPQDIDNAEKIVESLKLNFNTGSIVNLKTNKSFTVHNQMKIDGYSIDGMVLKSMLDKVIIDHKNKEVTPYDLKCTWSVENFYKEYYLFRKTYIQSFLYYKALVYCSNLVDSGFYGYTVNPTVFIVCDSINYYAPLIYTLTETDLEEAYLGFSHKYTQYPGVKEIIDNLKWAINHDTWDISKPNWEKKGFLNIKE